MTHLGLQWNCQGTPALSTRKGEAYLRRSDLIGLGELDFISFKASGSLSVHPRVDECVGGEGSRVIALVKNISK